MLLRRDRKIHVDLLVFNEYNSNSIFCCGEKKYLLLERCLLPILEKFNFIYLKILMFKYETMIGIVVRDLWILKNQYSIEILKWLNVPRKKIINNLVLVKETVQGSTVSFMSVFSDFIDFKKQYKKKKKKKILRSIVGLGTERAECTF